MPSCTKINLHGVGKFSAGEEVWEQNLMLVINGYQVLSCVMLALYLIKTWQQTGYSKKTVNLRKKETATNETNLSENKKDNKRPDPRASWERHYKLPHHENRSVSKSSPNCHIELDFTRILLSLLKNRKFHNDTLATKKSFSWCQY